MKKHIYPLLVVTLLLVSCNRYIAPPFTDVTKISQLRNGMKLKQVQDVLGIEPYDIYHLQEQNLSIVTFNYRLKKRSIHVPTWNRDEIERQTTNDRSQTAGELYYEKDFKVLYVLLRDGELTSFLTSDGYTHSNNLIVSKNTINFVTEKQFHMYDSTYLKGAYMVNLTKDKYIERKGGVGILNKIFKK
jgi:hypothetical protein